MVGKNKRKPLNLSATAWLTLSLLKACTALKLTLSSWENSAPVKGSRVTNTVGAQWPHTLQHSPSPGTHGQGRMLPKGLGPSLLCSARGDLPAPKSPRTWLSPSRHWQHTQASKWRRMSMTTNPVQPNLADKLELQFVVQNLVIVWVGGHMWEAQSDIFIKSLVHSVKLPQILCIHSAQDCKYLHELKHPPENSLCIAGFGTYWTA